MIESGAAPPMVDAFRRVRRCNGVACLDASFAVSATRARECRLYSALSIIAPSVNVLRRTRWKPSTIRGAAPDVVIGQSTAARTGARPYHLQLRITSLVACERRTGSASLPPLTSRLPICRRLGDLFRCLHHDLKWNFCQTPKIRMFVELRLVKEWRAHSAAKAGDLSGRRQRLSLLLK